MKRIRWKSDFSSEKSKTIRSEKRLKRENKEWKGISLKEHSQPADFKYADDADDQLISICFEYLPPSEQKPRPRQMKNKDTNVL